MAATCADFAAGTVVTAHLGAASPGLPLGPSGSQRKAGEGRLCSSGRGPAGWGLQGGDALPSWCLGAGGSRGVATGLAEATLNPEPISLLPTLLCLVLPGTGGLTPSSQLLRLRCERWGVRWKVSVRASCPAHHPRLRGSLLSPPQPVAASGRMGFLVILAWSEVP